MGHQFLPIATFISHPVNVSQKEQNSQNENEVMLDMVKFACNTQMKQAKNSVGRLNFILRSYLKISNKTFKENCASP